MPPSLARTGWRYPRCGQTCIWRWSPAGCRMPSQPARCLSGWAAPGSGKLRSSRPCFTSWRAAPIRAEPYSPAFSVREAFVHLHRGDLEEARKLLEEASAATDASSCGWWIGSDWSAARGWLAWEEGHLQQACAQLASAGGDDVIGNYYTISPGPVFLA